MPRFSIVTPVFDPPRDAWEACIASVTAQTEPDWEWCVADDRSTRWYVRPLLQAAAQRDPRIKVVEREQNGGIVAASNDALAAATGDVVALLDHDDLLHPRALERVGAALDAHPDADVVYTDEDKVDERGHHYDCFRKPDWSPERFRGQNYTSHLSVLRRDLVVEVGGFREGFDGSQDYDLFLRVIERARRVVHVPEVLYHWRAVSGSTAADFDAKPAAFDAAVRALDDHLGRTGVAGRAERAPNGYYRIVRELTATPKVSIVIPTNGGTRRVWGVETCLVMNAVDSVLRTSTYPDVEIVVVADVPASPAWVLEGLQRLGGDRLLVVPYEKPFHFSDKVNLGAVHATGDVIVLLNDDVEVITPDWLEELVSRLQEPDVGMVGPKLLLADGRVQSAGHANLPLPQHLFAGAGRHDHGPFGFLGIAREATGVTGACAALRRSVFEEVGGLAQVFSHAFNDVDLAFKLAELGYRTVWTPFAELYHFESLSRDPTVTPAELDALFARWAGRVGWEPYAPTERPDPSAPRSRAARLLPAALGARLFPLRG